MATATLKALLLGEDRSAGKTMRGAADDAERAHSSFLGAAKGVGVLAAGFIGFAAVSKAKDFLGDSIGEARESQKVSAQTAAAIKSTGAAAGVSADQVGDLATAISNKTGIDDEQIQSSENMLLTFTNVRNELGKGNDIFNQATQTVTDMSVALGQSGKTSAIQLGKALNDPVKGVTALQKVGVAFTAQQKEQIKTLVASGDTLGAQKMILAELNKEFGGSAAAQATAGDRARVVWGNLKESVGNQLLPILDRLLGWFADSMPKIQAKVTEWWAAIQPAIENVKRLWGELTDRFHGGGTGPMSSALASMQSAWTSIRSIFSSGVTIVMALWRIFGSDLMRYAGASLRNVLQIISGVLNVISGIFKIFAGLLTGDWHKVWEGLKQVVRGVWQVISGLVRQGWNILHLVFSAGAAWMAAGWRGVWNALKAVVSAAWNGIKAAVSAGIGGLLGLIKSLPSRIKGALGDLGGLLLRSGEKIIEGLVAGIRNSAHLVSKAMKDVLGKARNFLPFSPAKEGPFSGKGWTTYSGQALMRGLADGITLGRATPLSAASSVLGELSDSLTGGLTVGSILATPQSGAAVAASLAEVGPSARYDGGLGRERSARGMTESEAQLWADRRDAQTIINLHLGGRVIQKSLLELKRHNGGASLGLE